MDKYELLKEKRELRGTIYQDFVKSVNKNSIYKSIILRGTKDKTAFYECEPYDDTYRCSDDDQFYDTCKKLERAFKRYYKQIFEKYGVDNITVDIYDQYSCSAGLSVYSDGRIETINF